MNPFEIRLACFREALVMNSAFNVPSSNIDLTETIRTAKDIYSFVNGDFEKQKEREKDNPAFKTMQQVSLLIEAGEKNSNKDDYTKNLEFFTKKILRAFKIIGIVSTEYNTTAGAHDPIIGPTVTRKPTDESFSITSAMTQTPAGMHAAMQTVTVPASTSNTLKLDLTPKAQADNLINTPNSSWVQNPAPDAVPRTLDVNGNELKPFDLPRFYSEQSKSIGKNPAPDAAPPASGGFVKGTIGGNVNLTPTGNNNMGLNHVGSTGSNSDKPIEINAVYSKQQIDDMVEMQNNVLYFAEHIKVDDINANKKKHLVLEDHHKLMLNAMVDNRSVIINVPRQTGKTTMALSYILWRVLFNRSTIFLICGLNAKHTSDLRNRTGNMFNSLLGCTSLPSIVSYNKTDIMFNNDSRILFHTTTANAGHGFGLNGLYLDEFGYSNKEIAGDFYTSIRPAVSIKGNFIITTSGGARGHVLEKIWNNPNSIFKNVHLTWQDIPSLKDVVQERLQYGAERIASEYEGNFI
jgi:hypothetical protein